MDHYQLYFMAGSVVLMGLWISRAVHRAKAARLRRWALARTFARPAAVMAAAWVVTLVGALAAGRAVGLS
jgi:hypothetical protein